MSEDHAIVTVKNNTLKNSLFGMIIFVCTITAGYLLYLIFRPEVVPEVPAIAFGPITPLKFSAVATWTPESQYYEYIDRIFLPDPNSVVQINIVDISPDMIGNGLSFILEKKQTNSHFSSEYLLQIMNNPLQINFTDESIAPLLDGDVYPARAELVYRSLSELNSYITYLQLQYDTARPADYNRGVEVDKRFMVGEPSTPNRLVTQAAFLSYLLPSVFPDLYTPDRVYAELTAVSTLSVAAGMAFPHDVIISQNVGREFYAALQAAPAFQALRAKADAEPRNNSVEAAASTEGVSE